MANSVSVKLLDAKHPDAGPHEHTDAESALRFLQEAARQKSNMAHFTALWEDLRPKRLKGRDQKDRDVLAGLAGLMASGRLRGQAARGGSGSGEDPEPAAPSPARSTPRPPRESLWPGSGMKIREAAETIKAAALPPINVAQQVDALKSAALSGVPFVEKCH